MRSAKGWKTAAAARESGAASVVKMSFTGSALADAMPSVITSKKPPTIRMNVIACSLEESHRAGAGPSRIAQIDHHERQKQRHHHEIGRRGRVEGATIPKTPNR